MALLARARTISRERFGKRITLYLPGMFVLDGERGRYPAISITGDHCRLRCDHCAGEILKPMPGATTPEALVELCLRLRDAGALGFLVTGGSDEQGRLPWDRFLGALAEVKKRTGLHLSVHSGMVDQDTALGLREAGVDQALLDVVGADETWQEVMHLEGGGALLRRSLDGLRRAGLQVVPHVVMGIHRGRILGERKALEILRDDPPSLLVWVALMPLPRTPMASTPPLPLEEAACLLADSRVMFPDTEISLGCARPRGKYRQALERIAMEAGVNRIALYSDDTVDHARSLGLEVEMRGTCCSVTPHPHRQKPGSVS
jgi:lipoyl synthase